MISARSPPSLVSGNLVLKDFQKDRPILLRYSGNPILIRVLGLLSTAFGLIKLMLELWLWAHAGPPLDRPDRPRACAACCCPSCPTAIPLGRPAIAPPRPGRPAGPLPPPLDRPPSPPADDRSPPVRRPRSQPRGRRRAEGGRRGRGL